MMNETLIVSCLSAILLILNGFVMTNCEDAVREPPCPNATDIAPCTCHTSPDDPNYIWMDCSDAEYEVDIQNAFLADFPTREYQTFYMKQNYNVSTLGDIFQGTTFRIITLIDVWALQTITEDAFSASTATLLKWIVDGTSIDNFNFPFHTIANYSKLTSFQVASSKLTSFPALNSATLSELWLQNNQITGTVGSTAFQSTPSLTHISIYYNNLTDIEPGAFSNMPYLNTVSMFGNSLTLLRSLAFQVSSDVSLGLTGMDIADVEPGAFTRYNSSVRMSISLSSNLITELLEYVWSDVLAADTYLSVSSNPLTCGCDIAWLLNNDTMMGNIDSFTTCADGRNLTDLDPADYAHC